MQDQSQVGGTHWLLGESTAASGERLTAQEDKELFTFCDTTGLARTASIKSAVRRCSTGTIAVVDAMSLYCSARLVDKWTLWIKWIKNN